MKPLTLVINQNNTTHKLELAKAVTFSNQATRRRLTEIEANDAKQDERLTAVEGVNTTQGDKININESDVSSLKKRVKKVENADTAQDDRLTEIEGVNTSYGKRLETLETKPTDSIRFYQGVEPADVEPLAVGGAIFDETITTARWNSTSFGYNKTRKAGSITNSIFQYKKVEYELIYFYHWTSSGEHYLLFEIKRVDNEALHKDRLNDLCILFDRRKMYMFSAANRYGRGSQVQYVFRPVNPSKLFSKGETADYRIEIEPLLWTETVPAYDATKKLFMAVKTSSMEDYQVVRVMHPDKP